MLSAYFRSAPIWALVAGVSMNLHPALAQEPNIETRVEQYVQPPQAEPPEPTVKIVKERQYRVISTSVPKSDADVSAELAQIQKDDSSRVMNAFEGLERQGVISPESGPSILALDNGIKSIKLSKLSAPQRANLLDAIPGRSSRKKITHTQVNTVDKKVVEPAKITTTASINSSNEYDSNAFSARSNAKSDQYLSLVPGIVTVIPVTGTSGLTLSLKAAYARYDDLTALDSDVLLGSAAYSTKLSAVQKNPDSKTVQEEVLTLQVVGQGIYDPGFSGPGKKIYSPALIWQLRNIPLGARLCGKPGSLVNCFVAGLTAELGRTWIGNDGAGKNSRARLGASADWNIHGTALVWSVSASVTDRYYEDFPGDRNDVFFSLGSTLTWQAAANVTLSAGAEYRNQSSSQEALQYEKYLLVPLVRASMNF
jgi:hypothetical protein